MNYRAILAWEKDQMMVFCPLALRGWCDRCPNLGSPETQQGFLETAQTGILPDVDSRLCT